MLPFGGPPGFSPLMNISPSTAPPPYLPTQVLLPPIPRMMAVSTATPPLHFNVTNTVAPVVPSGPRPMLVPPQMAAEIAANNKPFQMGASSASASGNASSGNEVRWTEHTASDSRVYYYNKVTKQSSWQKPDELKTPEEIRLRNFNHVERDFKERTAQFIEAVNSSLMKSIKKASVMRLWREYKTPEGKPYYYNVESKETTWTRPRDFDPSAKDKKVNATKVVVGCDGSSSEVKEGVASKASNGGESEIEKAMQATLKNLEMEQLSTKQHEHADENDSNASDLMGMIGDGEFDEDRDLKKKQTERFRELLRDKYNESKITSISSWEQAIKYLQHDPRFRLLSKVSEKKQLFNAWKVQRQKEERDEKRLAIKKAKEELESWLQNHSKLRSSMRYAKADLLFHDEPVWKAVHESERKEIYRDAMELRERKEKDEAKTTRRRNVQALADILEGMTDITYKTTWAQAQRLLIENPAFANDSTLQSMDKEDALIVFEEHIRTAEKHYLKEKDFEEKRRRRQERKIREAFHVFLAEMHQKGELTSMSLWSELYPVISSDIRFDNMLEQSGSTPLDLFKFFVEDLKSQFGQDRRIIKDILKDHNVTVTVTTSFDQLSKLIVNDERGKEVDQGNMKLCYNSLIEKAESKEREQERVEARKRRRQEATFRKLLHSLEPSIEPNSVWASIRPKIQFEEAFLAVDNEKLRETFFNDYIQTLSGLCGHYHSNQKKKKREKKKRNADKNSDSEIEVKPKKSHRRRRESDGSHDEKDRKRRKKSKRRSRSASRETSEAVDSNESEVSEGELERKRNELLNKLESSSQPPC